MDLGYATVLAITGLHSGISRRYQFSMNWLLDSFNYEFIAVCVRR